MTLVASIAGMIVLAFVIIVYVFVMQRSRGLKGAAQQKVRSVWLLIEKIDDPKTQILEADKVLDLSLKLLGYQGTLGEKLKRAGPRFSDTNAIWRAHKLRNSIAHELDAKVSPAQAAESMRAFKQALKDLGM